jgi:hypothetical protein
MDFDHDPNYYALMLKDPLRLDPTYDDENSLVNLDIVRERGYGVPFPLRRFVARPIGEFRGVKKGVEGTYVSFLLFTGPIFSVLRKNVLADLKDSNDQRIPYGGKSQLIKKLDDFNKGMIKRFRRTGGLFLPRFDFELRLKNLKEKPQRSNRYKYRKNSDYGNRRK